MSKSFDMRGSFDIIVSEGLEFVKNHCASDQDNPFMLYLPLTGPHTPWLISDEFENRSEVSVYGDFIKQIDDVVYRFTKLLTDLNIDENTILIFASDNGAPWEEEDNLRFSHKSNGKLKGQKGDLWEGGHRIPLIFSWPKIVKTPRKTETLVSLLDFYATFSDILGYHQSDNQAIDSFSFKKVLSGVDVESDREDLIHISSSGRLAITSGNWKLIDFLGSGGFTKPSYSTPSVYGAQGQLYYLKDDLSESNNLFLDYPEIVQQLSNLQKEIIEK